MKGGKKVPPCDGSEGRSKEDATSDSGDTSFAEAAGRLGGIKPLDRTRGPAMPRHPREHRERDDFAPTDRPTEPRDKPSLPQNKTRTQRGRGISNQDLRRLRGGQMRPELTVDLHGFTRDAARARLCNAVARARHSGYRCILVIHGKGQQSPGGEPVLRPALARWVEEPPLLDQVAASCPAHPRDGGSGASYLLLRLG